MMLNKCVGGTLIVLCISWAHGGAQEPVPASGILDRATAYVAEFVTKFAGVVAEEQYEQQFLQTSVEGGGGGNRSMSAPTGPPMPGSLRVTLRRKLRSDVLLVKPAGFDGWQLFRDVFEVDGNAVRDREDRLMMLFVDPRNTSSALERATQIMLEGARFNVRPIGTVDNPLLALTFLQHPIRERFRFTDRGIDASIGSNTELIEFRETSRPTVIRAVGDKDIIAKGRFWIEPRTGRVKQSEVIFSALGTDSTVTTTFAWDEHLEVNAPAEMRFKRSLATSEVRCVATYGSFRHFDVQTDESMVK